jgi:fumarate hydratase subunit alpha
VSGFQTCALTIFEAVIKCYTDYKFRKSMIDINGYNSINNLPAFFHFNPVEIIKSRVSFLIKGGGSENVSGVLNLLPGLNQNDISEKIVEYFISVVNSKACPPYFLGVGIGGSIEKAVINSKKALINYDFEKEDNFENLILKKLNNTKTGLFGTGIGDTVLGVKVILESSHIANNIVALSFNCHSLRRGVIEFE